MLVLDSLLEWLVSVDAPLDCILSRGSYNSSLKLNVIRS